MSIPFTQKLFGIFPMYSLMIVLGMGTAFFLLNAECKRKTLPKDTAVDIALVAIPCGIVGARLYYVLMQWPQYAQQPLHALYIWEGGLAIYGGVIGGMMGLWLYAKKHKLRFWTLCDAVLPGVLLAQAIGRWGNYFNMEAYGPVVSAEAFQFFPFCVQIFDGTQWQWHMATFFYESVWNVLGFCALWLMRKKMRSIGDMSCCYFLLYGSGRFMIEQLRTDSLYIGTLRASQWLSLLFCTAACILLLRQLHQHTRQSILCALLWVSRLIAVRFSFWLLLIITCLAVLWLIMLCKQRPFARRLSVLLCSFSLLVTVLSPFGWPISEAFWDAIVRISVSVAVPTATLLLYFCNARKGNPLCQTEP